ncbi:MAG: FHA domain-containing protein [Desulfurivibrionaceae bacterium]
MKIWTLMLKEKPVHRFIVREGKPVTIGRTSDFDVVLDNQSISRDHAVVEHDKGRDYLTDKGSTNGTWVNGEKITKRTRITDKDEIMVGKFSMVAGAVGLLDIEKMGQSLPMDDDLYTMYVAQKEKSLPDEKKPGFFKKLFKK